MSCLNWHAINNVSSHHWLRSSDLTKKLLLQHLLMSLSLCVCPANWSSLTDRCDDRQRKVEGSRKLPLCTSLVRLIFNDNIFEFNVFRVRDIIGITHAPFGHLILLAQVVLSIGLERVEDGRTNQQIAKRRRGEDSIEVRRRRRGEQTWTSKQSVLGYGRSAFS